MPAALTFAGFVFSFSSANAGDKPQWKPPETPKDDLHWFPEMPDNKELHTTVPNGGFEDEAAPAPGRPPSPKGWAHPDDFTSFWLKDAEAGHGKAIMLDTDVSETEAKKRQGEMREAADKGGPVPAAKKKTALSDAQEYDAIGATYGVSFYSEKFVCKEKQAYKVTFDFKGPSGGAKLWVRAWGPLGGEDRRRFETIVNCRTKGDGWRHFEQAFHPSRRPMKKDDINFIEVTYMRIMLFAYWPRGQYYFDNIKVEEIDDAEYARLKKIPADAK